MSNMAEQNISKINFFKISNSYLGVLYILLHSSLDVIFYVICKNDFQSKHIVSFLEEIIFVFVYNFKALILLIVYSCIKYLINKNINTKAISSIKIDLSKLLIYVAMSFFSVGGFITFLYGLKDMVIANAMSIKYVEQMLWVLVGVIVLNEKLDSKQVTGILVSILGVVIIIISNVKANTDVIIYILPIIAAICWTISSNLGKQLIKDQPSVLIHMVYYYLFHIIILLLLLVVFNLYFRGKAGVINISLGSYEFIIHILSMTFFYKALKLSPISLLAPFIYIKLVVAALLGYFIFSDDYDILELFSYTLIIFGGIKVLKTLDQVKST